MFERYIANEPRENLFGETLSEREVMRNAAQAMYTEARAGGASHAAAYAMMVEEAGAELADAAAARHLCSREAAMYDPRTAGWTHKERAEREAGIDRADY